MNTIRVAVSPSHRLDTRAGQVVALMNGPRALRRGQNLYTFLREEWENGQRYAVFERLTLERVLGEGG